jgi:hypothetical protein
MENDDYGNQGEEIVQEERRQEEGRQEEVRTLLDDADEDCARESGHSRFGA